MQPPGLDCARFEQQAVQDTEDAQCFASERGVAEAPAVDCAAPGGHGIGGTTEEPTAAVAQAGRNPDAIGSSICMSWPFSESRADSDSTLARVRWADT